MTGSPSKDVDRLLSVQPHSAAVTGNPEQLFEVLESLSSRAALGQFSKKVTAYASRASGSVLKIVDLEWQST